MDPPSDLPEPEIAANGPSSYANIEADFNWVRIALGTLDRKLDQMFGYFEHIDGATGTSSNADSSNKISASHGQNENRCPNSFAPSTPLSPNSPIKLRIPIRQISNTDLFEKHGPLNRNAPIDTCVSPQIQVCSRCNSVQDTLVTGLCRRCYVKRRFERNIANCVECNEMKPILSRGLCKRCYGRAWHKRGSITNTGLCSECGDETLIFAKGLCKSCCVRFKIEVRKPRTSKPRSKTERTQIRCRGCDQMAPLWQFWRCRACYEKFQASKEAATENNGGQSSETSHLQMEASSPNANNHAFNERPFTSTSHPSPNQHPSNDDIIFVGSRRIYHPPNEKSSDNSQASTSHTLMPSCQSTRDEDAIYLSSGSEGEAYE